MKHKTALAHQFLIDYMAAQIAGARVEFESGAMRVALESDRVDQVATAWRPREDAQQLELIEVGQPIRVEYRDDGYWIGSEGAGAQQIVGTSRAEAVLRCAVFSTYGPIFECQAQHWPDLTVCLQAADPWLQTRAAPARPGALSGACLQGAVFPLQGWEVVKIVEGGGGVRYETLSLQVTSVAWGGREGLHLRISDARGDSALVPAEDVFVSQECASAYADSLSQALRNGCGDGEAGDPELGSSTFPRG